ncbi:MAG: DsbA family protein, partial [Bacteroidales bacterium]|nr:DsbA family protein [Bacteroidales bacterium]
KAFFTDGENIADHTTLSKLGAELGFDEKTMQDVLDDHRYAIEVNRDIQEARNLGVNGVPFFVFNRKYAISGAQPSHVFFETLQKSFSEWREQNPVPQLEIQQGQSCNVDGICE